MNNSDQIEQIKYFVQWIKDNGLNPKLWDLIDETSKELMENME